MLVNYFYTKTASVFVDAYFRLADGKSWHWRTKSCPDDKSRVSVFGGHRKGARWGLVGMGEEAHGVPTVAQRPQASSAPGRVLATRSAPHCSVPPTAQLPAPHCSASCPCPSDVAGEVCARQVRMFRDWSPESKGLRPQRGPRVQAGGSVLHGYCGLHGDASTSKDTSHGKGN